MKRIGSHLVGLDTYQHEVTLCKSWEKRLYNIHFRILNSRKWKLFTKIIFTFSASGLRYLLSSWTFSALHCLSSTGRNLQSLFYSLSQKTLTSRLYFTLSYMPDATLTSCLYFPSVECHTNQPSLFHSKSPTANHGKQPPLFKFYSTISSNYQLTTSLFQF